MTQIKNITLAEDGILDTLRLADIHRRSVDLPLLQGTIVQISKNLKQVADIVDVCVNDFGVPGLVTRSDERRSMRRQMIAPLNRINETAARAGAHTIVLPFQEASEAASIVNDVVQTYRIQGNFVFMTTPYKTDLSGLGPINRQVVDNVLYLAEDRFKTLSHLLFVDGALRHKWIIETDRNRPAAHKPSPAVPTTDEVTKPTPSMRVG